MKLLIADHEMQIRNGLKAGIDWTSLGFEAVFTAANGVEAMEICRKEMPEVIITDIRMPGIDGLELGRQVRELYPFAEIIILSGYSEFEYARDAIKMGAFDYLLKPINIPELEDRVRNAQAKVIEEKKKFADRDRAAELSRSLKRQKLLQKTEPLTASEKEWLDDSIPVPEGHRIAAGICSADKQPDGNGDQFGIYLMQYLKQYFESGGEAGFTAGSLRLLYRTHREIRFVMDVLTEADFDRKCGILRSGLETLNRILQVQYGNTVTVVFSGLSTDGMTVGAGTSGDAASVIAGTSGGAASVKTGAAGSPAVPPHAHSLPVLLRAAEDTLKCRMYLGPGHLILQEEVGPKELPLSPVDPTAVRECVRGLSLSGCETYIRGLFDTLQKRKVTSSDFVRGICVEMKNLLLSTLQESGIDLNWLTESNAELLNDIPDYATIAEYREWTDSLFYLILSGIAQITGKQHSRVIVEAMDFIAKHYNQDISLDAVADHVSKSRNYFSYLFRKEVGMTYVEYLNTIRVEKARRLLDTTDDMAYEIAAKVGYSDSRYFSMVFRKLTGVAPNQYRNRES